MNFTLHEDAAKKIARLAEGSMRDALTYLDQCYAMADTEITLDNVNETLGLISDESLDEIISAVTAKDRAAVARAVTKSFRSGLAANAIAEVLITRLRDREFEMLDRNDKNFSELDRIIDALRKAIGEMYGSGIPDIILEMTLMKLTAPDQNFSAPIQVVQTSAPTENLDASRKIFYDVIAFLSGEDSGVDFIVNKAIALNFAGNVLTLGFKSPAMANLFKTSYLSKFERAAAQVVGRAVKISVVFDENLPLPILSNMSEPARSNLAGAMDIFHASDAAKLND